MRRTVALGVLCVSFGLVSVGSASASAGLPSTTSDLHTVLNLDQFQVPTGGYTSAELAGFAQSDLIQVNPTKLTSTQLQTIRTDNPAIKIYAYVNGIMQPTPPNDGTVNYPTSWYMKDAASHYVTHVEGTTTKYMMDPRSAAVYQGFAGWTSWVAHTCAQQQGTFDGCYIDLLGDAPVLGSPSNCNYVSACPIDSTTGQTFTKSSYLNMTGGLAQRVATANNQSVIGNGLNDGDAFYSDPTSILLPYMDGALAETTMRDPTAACAGTWPSLASWKNEVQMLIDAGPNKVIEFEVKLWVNGCLTTNIDRWRKFSAATFLIGNQGHGLFAFSNVDTVNNPSGFEYSDPLYGLTLGSNLQDNHTTVQGFFRSGSGLYRRDFKNASGTIIGVALANPDTVKHSVNLPGCFKNSEGAQHSTWSIPLDAGEVLQRVSATNC